MSDYFQVQVFQILYVHMNNCNLTRAMKIIPCTNDYSRLCYTLHDELNLNTKPL